jgi:enoyl-CoA hydratase
VAAATSDIEAKGLQCASSTINCARMSRFSLDPDAVPDAVDGIAVAHAGPVTTVVLSRPDSLNAITLAGWQRIAAVFADLAKRSELRCVVVHGAGDRAFAAGADISEFRTHRTTAASAQHYNESIERALESIIDLQRPVIAVVRGLAVGGGCELAASCDLRIASDSARFGIPIGRLGVTLGYVESRVLTQLIGPARLKDLLFTGRLVDAREALAIGLVDRVVDATQLMPAVQDVVEAILCSSPTTIRAAKVVTNMCGRPLTAADRELLAALTVEAYEGAELQEGIAAFLEKRRPSFESRSPTSVTAC